MRTVILSIMFVLFIAVPSYASEGLDLCFQDGIQTVETLRITNTGEIKYGNGRVTHVADTKINYRTTNIYQRGQILYLTNLTNLDSSVAIAVKNNAWIIFHDNGSLLPRKGDYVATAIFHDSEGMAVGECNTYTPIMAYKGMLKIEGRRGRIEDVDLYTNVGLIYIDEHNDLVVTRDDTADQLVIHHDMDGFVVSIKKN